MKIEKTCIYENGQMTASASVSSLTYNWDGKLRSGGDITSLKYDPAGNRIRKEYQVGSTPYSRKYIVDIVGELPVILLEIDTSDTSITKAYIYADAQPLAQHDYGTSSGTYFYLHDRLGSVRLMINNDGAVQNYYTYNPFGELLETSENVTNSFKFAGQWLDPEISQYYLRARMYDPYISRFTSRDSIIGNFNEPLTLHKYLYCLNDPINKFDLNLQIFFFLIQIIGTNAENILIIKPSFVKFLHLQLSVFYAFSSYIRFTYSNRFSHFRERFFVRAG